MWDRQVSKDVGLFVQNRERPGQTRTVGQPMCLQRQHKPTVTRIRTKVIKSMK